MNTFAYLLSALVTADMSADERERARTRFENRPGRRLCRGGRGAPRPLAARDAAPARLPRDRGRQYFESHDVFLLPTAFTAAFPHDHSEPIDNRVVDTPEGKRPYVRDMPSWISAATLAGLPATVAPVGRTDAGLPVGIQIIAPMWEDGTSIEFAALLSDLVGGFTAPSAFRE